MLLIISESISGFLGTIYLWDRIDAYGFVYVAYPNGYALFTMLDTVIMDIKGTNNSIKFNSLMIA